MLIGQVTPEPELKEERLQKAIQTQQDIIRFVDDVFPEDKARRAMAYSHYTDTLLEQIKYGFEKGQDITEFINLALPALQYAFENLGGSKAAKATLWNKKAQLVYAQGDTEGAFLCLQNGEIAIFDGYAEEMQENDGLMKIRIWQTGLWMTRAFIYVIENKKELAKLYLEAILSIEDSKGTLGTRKNQAKRLLAKL